jgi:hypothetical protein
VICCVGSDVTLRRKGLTLIADVRGTNGSVLKALIDTLRHVEVRKFQFKKNVLVHDTETRRQEI